MDTPAANSVVVGVDRSQAASEVLAWAAREALARKVELHAVHAVSPDSFLAHRHDISHRLTEAGEWLESTARRLEEQHPGLIVTWETVTEEPVPALVKLSEHVALEVVGARGMNRFAGVLLGSTSQRLVAHSACPVVVVRDGAAEEEAQETGNPPVVLGAEPGEPAAPVEFAFAQAARWKAPLLVMRAWTYPPAYPGHYAVPEGERRRQEAEEHAELKALLAQAREAFPQVQVIEDIQLAPPEEALTDASREARLVVVGTRRHRGAFALALGRVTLRVLHHSRCPVAVVPT